MAPEYSPSLQALLRQSADLRMTCQQETARYYHLAQTFQELARHATCEASINLRESAQLLRYAAAALRR